MRNNYKIEKSKEALKYHNTLLQYNLSRARKGERYQQIRNNTVETWNALHIAYDHGQQIQRLQSVQRVVQPAWATATTNANFM
eukprot:2100387-Amphidinium_carterae.1